MALSPLSGLLYQLGAQHSVNGGLVACLWVALAFVLTAGTMPIALRELGE